MIHRRATQVSLVSAFRSSLSAMSWQTAFWKDNTIYNNDASSS
jgi:hypothetical protein